MKTYNPTNPVILITLILAMTVLTMPLLKAADVFFSNPSGGDWNAGTNWDNHTGPVAGDGAFLTAITNTSYTVNYDTVSTNAPWNLQISNGSGYFTTLNINASGFQTSFTNNTKIERGVVNINSGGSWNYISGNFTIAQGSTVYVNGGNLSTGSSSSQIIIGHTALITNSVAKLQIDSGTIDFSKNIVSIGSFSKGLVEINGGTFTTDIIRIGTGNSLPGSKLLVTGGNLEIKNLAMGLSVGQASNAEMEVTGGTISNRSELRIATQAANVTAILTQSSGTWLQNHHVYIASLGATNTSGTFKFSGGTFTMTNASHNTTMSIGNSTNSTIVGKFEKTGGSLTLDNLNVNATGYLMSGSAQIWSLFGNFTNNSAKNTQFDMTGATVDFIGGRTHAMVVAGQDLGQTNAGYINNYAMDALSLATASDKLTLSLTNGALSGALYINSLLLPGNNTNLISSNITGINGLIIYYQPSDSRNSYLNGLTYSLGVGGSLMPVPEPKTTASLAIMACLSLAIIVFKRRGSLQRLLIKNRFLLKVSLLVLLTVLTSYSVYANSENAVFEHTFSPDDTFDMANPESQSKVFESGPFPNTQALNLKETDSPQSGIFFSVDTTPLAEGTVEMWIYPESDASSKAKAILNLGSSGNTKWRISLNKSRLYAIFDQASPAKSAELKSEPIEMQEWHHVALTWSDKGVKFFVDGMCVDELNEPATLWQMVKKEHLQVGDMPDYNKDDPNPWVDADNNFIGRVANLRILNVAKEGFSEIQKPK